MNSATPAPLLIDDRTARQMLGGLSSRTLYTLRTTGDLPHCRIGTRVMYSPAELAKWIARRQNVEATR